MDDAHEVELGALLRGYVEVDRLALLALAGDAGVAGPVDVGRRVLADAVLEELELGRSLRVRVRAVRLRQLVADLAVEDLLGGAWEVLLLHDRERVWTLVRSVVDDM